MDPNARTWKLPSALLLTVLGCVCFVVGVGLLIHLDQKSGLPGADSLLRCDAGWYSSIRKDGYQYNPNGANNTAFFPLFPYLWRWLHLDAVGISIVNALLFTGSCAALMHVFPTGWRTRLLFLCLSILVFYVTPFSESLFFFFGVLLLAGLEKRQPVLTGAGLLGAGLTRSVGLIILPALIIVGLDQYLRQRKARPLLHYALYALVTACAVLIVFGIQGYQTGEAAAFIKTQKSWGSGWRMPGIPFTTWPPEDNGLYDQLALFASLLCIAEAGAYLWRSAFKRVRGEEMPPAELLSILYTAGVGLLMAFNRGGSFNSMNRYVFAAPFFYLLLRRAARRDWKAKHAIIVAVLGLVYFLVGWHSGTSLYRASTAAGLLALTLCIPLLLRRRHPAMQALYWAVCATTLYMQAHLWMRFVSDVWVG